MNEFDKAKLRIIREFSKEYFAVIDAEDTAVADFTTFAGGKQLDVAPTSVEIVSQGDPTGGWCRSPLNELAMEALWMRH